MVNDLYNEQEHICPECGKDFLVFDPEWVYRSGKGKGARLFCSWKCLRSWEKNKPSKIDRRMKILAEIYDHPEMEPREIAKKLNEEPKVVWYWWQKVQEGD